MKKRLIVLVAMALAALLGHSQQSSSGTPPPTNGSSSTSTGTGTANAVVNQITSSRAGFVQAIPGGVPGTFPGFAPEDPGCQMGTPRRMTPTTRAAIEASANAGKLPHGVKAFPINHKSETPYDGPIGFMNYNPDYVLNPGDQVLTSIILPGKYHQNMTQLREIAERELEKAAPGMQRIAIVNCPEVESVTKANTLGFGVTVSGTPESGNVAGSGAVGFTHGTNKSMRQAHPTLYAYAMNEGGLDYIPPEPQGGSNNQPPTPTPTMNLNVKMDLEPLIPLIKELIAAKPAPAPTMPVPAINLCADLPRAVVYFRFNISVVDPEYLPVVKSVEDWMVQHPSCKVSVEGYASFEGGNHFNDGLGQDRSQRVFDILAKNKDIADRLTRHLSAGKHFTTKNGPNPEYTKEDRKVVFSIRNVTSENQ
jgi:outer membrane protein OmpA-like peptidoglycan-associated protein